MTTAQKLSTKQMTEVAEPWMISLYALTPNDSMIKDENAVELVEIDYDFTKFADGCASQLGSVIRVKTYDPMLHSYSLIHEHPNAIVIALGLGLCTRFYKCKGVINV